MDRIKKEIEGIIQERELFEKLDKKIVLITGATGMIGSMLVKTLHEANVVYGFSIRILAQIRNEEKVDIVYGALAKEKDIIFVKECNDKCDYIVHTISPTNSKFFIEHPVETIQTSVISTMRILKVAKVNKASMVYLSSMEQYGIPYQMGEKMTEDKIGIIDHLNVRSSYSESKRLCECLCTAYAREYKLNVKIARLAQTYGVGVPLSDGRMPMQFAKAVVERKDIVLHTEGKSISNSIYISDAITGILTILDRGIAGEAYNICNDTDTRSVKEIAELVSQKIADGKIKVKIEIPQINMGYAPDTYMYLDSTKLQQLGWKPRVRMEEAYKRLVEYLNASLLGE